MPKAKAKAKKKKRRMFRAPATKAEPGEDFRVDRDDEIIYGFAVITKGEVRGHGFEADDETLRQVLKLGKAAGRPGIKSRFGHPNMSETALGTLLGRAKKFRRDGDLVRADLHIQPTAHETPNGDLASYVLDLAEEDPSAFGSSIVYDGHEEYRVNKDGTLKRDDEGNALPPLARVDRLWAADIVDEPAANEGGLFESGGARFFTADVELSARAASFLDGFVDRDDAEERLDGFLRRYLGSKDNAEGKVGAFLRRFIGQRMEEAHTMPDDDKTTIDEESFAKGHARGKKDGAEESDRQLSEKVSEAEAAGAKKERERIAAIQEHALEGQEEIVQTAIREGWPVEKALSALLKDGRERDGKRLGELETDEVPELGVAPEKGKTPPAKAPEPEDGPIVDKELAKKAWEGLPADERRSFGHDFDDWYHYQLNEDRTHGAIKSPEEIAEAAAK